MGKPVTDCETCDGTLPFLNQTTNDSFSSLPSSMLLCFAAGMTAYGHKQNKVCREISSVLN